MTQYRFRRSIEADRADDGEYRIRLPGGGTVPLLADVFEALLEPDGEDAPENHPGSAPPPTW